MRSHYISRKAERSETINWFTGARVYVMIWWVVIFAVLPWLYLKGISTGDFSEANTRPRLTGASVAHPGTTHRNRTNAGLDPALRHIPVKRLIL